MRPGYLNGVDIPAAQVPKIIKNFYKKQQDKSLRPSNFNVWMNLYARPAARGLWQSHYNLKREQSLVENIEAKALASQDPGLKAVAEVKVIADKLVKTEKRQDELKEEADKKLAKGDMAGATKAAQKETMMAQKAEKIKGQLSKRVDEGIKLAKAKKTSEQAKMEVDMRKKQLQDMYPHLSAVWAKHDAKYDQQRAQLKLKHELAEAKDEAKKQKLKATLPPSHEKDAKMERLRKQAAERRIKETLEVARLDDDEAGRLQAREKQAKK
jgi:hypothetical protein